MEEPGRLYSPWGCKESDTTERLTLSAFRVSWVPSHPVLGRVRSRERSSVQVHDGSARESEKPRHQHREARPRVATERLCRAHEVQARDR